MVCTIARSEFSAVEGCVMFIDRALYGLQTSGNEWHQKFANDLFAIGFVPLTADSDLWICEKEEHYELIWVFVDNALSTCILSKSCWNIQHPKQEIWIWIQNMSK